MAVFVCLSSEALAAICFYRTMTTFKLNMFTIASRIYTCTHIQKWSINGSESNTDPDNVFYSIHPQVQYHSGLNCHVMVRSHVAFKVVETNIAYTVNSNTMLQPTTIILNIDP